MNRPPQKRLSYLFENYLAGIVVGQILQVASEPGMTQTGRDSLRESLIRPGLPELFGCETESGRGEEVEKQSGEES